MPFSALYDANVLYPFEVRDVLMVAARTRTFRVLWSDDILDECARNLIKDEQATRQSMDRMFAAMKRLYPEATVSKYQQIIPSMSCHKKDRHVLAAAVVGKADVIVTNDRKGFPFASIKPYGIETQSPDEFACNVIDLAPATFVNCFQANAALRHRPPITAEQLAKDLSNGPMPITGSQLLAARQNALSTSHGRNL